MNRDSRRTRVVLALLLLTAFTLITLDFRGDDRSPVDPLRGFAAAVFGPVERAAAAVVRPVSGAVTSLGELGDNEQRIDDLRRKNDDLRLKLHTSQRARARAAELDKLLRVAGVGRYRVLPAQVIAVGSAQGFSWTATIDAGTRDGVHRDMTVLNGDGLVGRVKTVGPMTATVLLANDATSSVGTRMEGSQEIGTVSGKGDGPLELELLDGQSRVGSGDRIVTLGSRNDRPFVPGVPVGEVVRVRGTPGTLTRSASVRSYVDFTALDVVGVVVQPPRADPRDAVLPRRSLAGETAVPSATKTGRG